MKPKALMLLAVAVGCGLVAMLGVQQAMKGGQAKAAPIETHQVLMVIKDTVPGERLVLDQNVKFEAVPITTLVPYKGDVVVKPEEFEERAAKIPLTTNDIVRKSKLTEKGQYGASGQIPKGMRVFTFVANETHIHAGLLRPGDNVDVTVSFTDRKGIVVTKVLLECIEVFATENKTVNSEDNKNEQRARSVSLLVTPEQDGFVKIAQMKGQLALSLRNPEDDEVNNLNGINSAIMEDLQRSIGNDDMPGYERRRMDDEDRFPDEATPSEPSTELAHAPTPDPEAATPPPAEAAPNTPAVPSNVQGFLKNGSSGESESASAPKPKRWSMKIYNGNEPTSVEVDDPTPVETPPATQGVPGLLKSWWSSGQK